jgi:aspartyl-tRNA(Asn)/glutamyl-tRNA(Gln) amidotransferase subunit A
VLSRRLHDRAISPVALADLYLARLDALRLDAVVTPAADRARADARAADAELAQGRWRGPLHGIPVLLADAIDTKGLPTGLGVQALSTRTPADDATVAARLAELGAVLLGKARVAPLGGALGLAACRDPWDPAREVRGAAPGAAAAVAAGLAPFALAVHGPEADLAAAACGVTALRPTYGVLSRAGVVAGSFTVAAVGPVARSAEDAALVLDALAGADGRDPSSIGVPPGLARIGPELPKGLRVGVIEGPAPEGAERDFWLAAQEGLRAAGALLAPAALPPMPWVELAALLAGAEGEVLRADLAPSAAPARGPATAATAADYVRAARIRGEAQRALGRLLASHDLLLAPAPRGEVDVLGAAVAVAGVPAVTFPVGLAGRRPVAARLVAPPLEEARALSAVALLQARSSHHLQRPPLAVPPAVAAVTRR